MRPVDGVADAMVTRSSLGVLTPDRGFRFLRVIVEVRMDQSTVGHASTGGCIRRNGYTARRPECFQYRISCQRPIGNTHPSETRRAPVTCARTAKRFGVQCEQVLRMGGDRNAETDCGIERASRTAGVKVEWARARNRARSSPAFEIRQLPGMTAGRTYANRARIGATERRAASHAGAGRPDPAPAYLGRSRHREFRRQSPLADDCPQGSPGRY